MMFLKVETHFLGEILLVPSKVDIGTATLRLPASVLGEFYK